MRLRRAVRDTDARQSARPESAEGKRFSPSSVASLSSRLPVFLVSRSPATPSQLCAFRVIGGWQRKRRQKKTTKMGDVFGERKIKIRNEGLPVVRLFQAKRRMMVDRQLLKRRVSSGVLKSQRVRRRI